MDKELLSQVIAYSLPALIVGATVYAILYKFFNYHLQLKRAQFSKDMSQQSLERRLQAYERMVLFLERITPNKLLLRMPPSATDDKMLYLQVLIDAVENEFQHNLTQQIYMSTTAWDLITTSKNSIIKLLKDHAVSTDNPDAATFHESVLLEGLNEQSSTKHAITFIKQEVADLF
ncbi:MAG: hypothetical protein CR968_04275 [Flavobacteriia bacterium]|nr:MAG: hypothetical protein CR968_04275 [Flavobacteriia bacterium]